MAMTLKDQELWTWLGINHPARCEAPPYWYLDYPGRESVGVTAGAWCDPADEAVVVEVFETIALDRPPFSKMRSKFHLRVLPASGDLWLIDRLELLRRPVSLNDDHAVRLALLQFRAAAEAVRAGEPPRITPVLRRPAPKVGLGAPPGDSERTAAPGNPALAPRARRKKPGQGDGDLTESP